MADNAAGGDRTRPEDEGFLSSLADLRRELDAAAVPVDLDELDRIDVASAPIITTPGQRPLLDLFPLFFPHDEHSTPAPYSPPTLVPEVEPLTYEPFFGLPERAFSERPVVKFLFRSHAYDHAEGRVLAALNRHDRLVVVTGEPGAGKTMLCQAVLPLLDRRTVACFVADPVLSLDDFFETLLTDFGVISRKALHRGARAGLADALRDFLVSLARIHTSAVVIVDDAQNLSQDVLRGLRTLVETSASDETGGRRPLLQLVLAGEPDLLTVLSRSELKSLVPALSEIVVLGPLQSDEVSLYIRHRLSVAGNDQVEFDSSAVKHIAEYSVGIPGMVNQLCDRAMAEAHRQSVSTIELASVTAAADRLDLGPAAPPPRGIWSGVLMGLAVGLLLLLGAAIAAAVFRDQVSAILSGQ